LETLHRRRIFEVVEEGKSGSQVGLRRVVDFETISLKVPQEVSGAQAICMRLIVLPLLLRGTWCRGYLLPDIVVDLPGVDWLLTSCWDNNNELLLATDSSSGVGIFALLALFICFSVLRWYVCGDDQDLAI
jgi:hypothetical protein